MLQLYLGGVLFLLFFNVQLNAEGNEFRGVSVCQLEKFAVTCPKNHVILITSAKFGRMRMGRCLSRDYFVGCNIDVITQLDANCSGRAHCEVPVPNENLVRFQICPNDLVSYLEVEYECVKVSEPCHGFDKVTVGGPSGYLTSQPHSQCAYVIQVSSGQRIELSLYDFYTPSKVNSAMTSSRDVIACDVYAEVYEDDVTGAESRRKICAKENRQTVVFKSMTSKIHVTVYRSSDNEKKFLLKYTAVGCADPTPPVDAYVIRHGEAASVVCNRSTAIWHLACDGSSWNWNDSMGNCTRGTSPDSHTMNTGTSDIRSFGIPVGIIVAVMVGVVLGVTLGVSLLCVVVHVRRRVLYKRRPEIGGVRCRDQNEPFIDMHPLPIPISKVATYYEPCTFRTRTVNDDYGQRPMMTSPMQPQLSVMQQEALPLATTSAGCYERTFSAPHATICSDAICQYCGDVAGNYAPALQPDVTSRSPQRMFNGASTPRVLRHIVDDL